MSAALTRKVLIAFGGALILLGLIGLFSWRSTHRLTEASVQATHVHQIHVAVDRLTTALDEAEAQRCEYVRTGEASHREAFRAVRELAGDHLRELRNLVGAGSEQGHRLEAVERAVAEKLALLERSFKLRGRNRFDMRGQWALTVRLRESAHGLRRGLEEVKVEEGARLARWQARAQDAAGQTFVLIDVGNLFALAGVGLAVFGIRRDLKAWGRSEGDLRQAHRQTVEEVEQQRGQLAVVHERLDEQANRCRQLEDRCRQTEKLSTVGRMTGEVAHDFNNLLTVILNCAAVIHARLTVGEPIRELAGHVVQAGEKATALTRRLLAFTRNRPTRPGPLDLTAVVAEMATLARYLIGRKIEVTTALAADLRPVLADRGQMEQVVLNLIVNARDAMPDGGRLLLQTRNLGAEEAKPLSRGVLLAVADTGCGMDEATQARVFEPLFTTKGEGKGTGLGMGIVKEIVQGSGGHVRIVSAPGKGTTVQIVLPSACGGAGLPEGPPPCSVTVLLVGPQGLVEDPLLRVLRQLGYTVLQAAGPEAVALVQEARQPIHVLIAPLGDTVGADLVRQLAALRPEMRVLYVAEGAIPPHVRRDVVGPETSVLPKPFTLEGLQRKLSEVLGAKG